MERKGNKREYRRLYVIVESDIVLKGWSKKELRELGGRHYNNVKLNDDDPSTTSVWKIPVDCKKIIESKVCREGSDIGGICKTGRDGGDGGDGGDRGDICVHRGNRDIRSGVTQTELSSDISDDVSGISEQKKVVYEEVKSTELENQLLIPDIMVNKSTVNVGTSMDMDVKDMNRIQFSDYKLGAYQEIRDRCKQYSEMVELTKSIKTK